MHAPEEAFAIRLFAQGWGDSKHLLIVASMVVKEFSGFVAEGRKPAPLQGFGNLL
jgi:hypothetical protein